MSPAAPLLAIDFPAAPRSVALARRAVLEALSGLAVDRAAVSIVVSEAVTNAVIHAYRDHERPGLVHVRASIGDDSVEIAVSDDGTGLRPRLDSPGAGLGLPLIADLADRVDLHNGAGVHIAAHFTLMDPAGPHGRPPTRTGHAQRRAATLV